MAKEFFFAQIKKVKNPPKSYDSGLLLETFEILPTIKKQAIAIGYWTSEGFLLLENSFVKKENTATTNKGIHEILSKIMKKGYLINFENFPDYYLLTQSIYLSSPSSASDLVHGCDTNGLELWRDSISAKTLNEL